ncbi:hypothetical protein ABE504_23640 [Paenibacillus oryzisoli]|uniref:hypothetical protein n=1 Tax=Paenibacillus oryzisoli TaxID=1850517 RepID=UPI003D2E6707
MKPRKPSAGAANLLKSRNYSLSPPDSRDSCKKAGISNEIPFWSEFRLKKLLYRRHFVKSIFILKKPAFSQEFSFPLLQEAE